jgi:demethylmenaquinone methyltransferase/2-methoxy-6-polyprenyl-1,4-benzoquinol methylase
MKGTAPPGARDEREAAAWVRAMFARVARRYDLANHLLSFNIDRLWRARTVRRVRPILERPGARVLDICCGTGDLTLALARACPTPAVSPSGRACPAPTPHPGRGEACLAPARRCGVTVLGSDFCHPMMLAARGKAIRAGLFEADALRLPLRDASLDLVTVAFGFRNLANYRAGLAEMRRVLRPNGMAAILEFSEPPNAVFAALYHFYSRRILPLIGGALSGSRDAYTYLPESVRKFPSAEELAVEMRRAGFAEVRYERFTGGIVALHLGVTPPTLPPA